MSLFCPVALPNVCAYAEAGIGRLKNGSHRNVKPDQQVVSRHRTLFVSKACPWQKLNYELILRPQWHISLLWVGYLSPQEQ
jgi:hypothetical protein